MAGHSGDTVSTTELWGGGRSPFSVSYGKLMMWLFLVSDALTFSGLLIGYGFIRHTYEAWPVGEKVFQSLPFAGDGFPLIYVALMTFILIVSSVTMVLAVEAGHRLDKKDIIKWLTLTVIGGLFFLLSQVWEWSHFIHGGGGFITTTSGEVYHLDHLEEDLHEVNGTYVMPEHLTLIQNKYGEGEHTVIEGAAAEKIWGTMTDYYHGANMLRNEYAPHAPQYANFFITGFHGFHVFSGVIINLLVLLQVRRGAYDERGHFEMVEKTGLYWHFVDLVWVFVFTFYYLV
ncbi:MAG: cytochrome c oxidase subunit 3 [Bacteroidetes bacterium]|nr:cytochrome c oxidase subunit 3 [Bacteroidota bacterium]